MKGVYERGRYGQKPVNSTRLANVTREQCEQQCILAAQPVCHSVDYHATRRVCLMNELTAERGGPYFLHDEEKGWTHSEKICKRKPCNGHWAYIQVPGVRIINHYHNYLAPSSIERCKDVCSSHPDSICESFTVELFNYFPSCSTSKQYRQTVPNDFVPSSNYSYYERTCLTSKRVCRNGTWQMDYVRAWKMTAGIGRVLANISSATCRKKCLHEDEFDCHSINYHVVRRVCELGEEDTETRPKMMRQARGWMYFEKSCIPDKPNFIGYKKIINGRWDGNILTSSVSLSREECLDRCNKKRTCRSANFNRYTNECQLNRGIYFNDVQFFRVKPGWEYHETKIKVFSEADTSSVLQPIDLVTRTRPKYDWRVMTSATAWKDPNPAPPGDPYGKTKRTWIATVEYADVPFKKQVGIYTRTKEYEIYNSRKGPFLQYTYYDYAFKPGRRYLLSIRLRIGNNTSPSENILLQHPKEVIELRPKNVKVRGIGRRSRRGFKAVKVSWDKFTLRWTHFSGIHVLGYVTKYKTLSSSHWASVNVDKNMSSTVIHSLTANTPYLFKVEAVTTLEQRSGYKLVSTTTSFFTGTLRFASARMIDCTAVYHEISKKTGIYTIWPVTSPKPFKVLCEKGWTIVQRNGPTMDRSPFDGDWVDFKTGFMNETSIHWLGLDKLYYLTNQATYKLTINVELPWNNNRKSFTYQSFRVENETDLYRLHTDGFKGPKGFSDVFDFKEFSTHQKQPFSTRDRDYDRSLGNCAQRNGGGWWWDNCGHSINAKFCKNYYHRKPRDCATWPKDLYRIKEVWNSLMKIKIHNGGRPLQPEQVQNISAVDRSRT